MTATMSKTGGLVKNEELGTIEGDGWEEILGSMVLGNFKYEVGQSDRDTFELYRISEGKVDTLPVRFYGGENPAWSGLPDELKL
jgi:hypothetical protein